MNEQQIITSSNTETQPILVSSVINLQATWQSKLQEISECCDFKNLQLPLARIKRIMKTDEDVKMISGEVPMLFAKACEMFILELTIRSWLHTEENHRRTLQTSDIALAISKTDVFDFLIDIVPRDEVKASKKPSGDALTSSRIPLPADMQNFLYMQPILQQQAHSLLQSQHQANMFNYQNFQFGVEKQSLLTLSHQEEASQKHDETGGGSQNSSSSNTSNNAATTNSTSSNSQSNF